MELVDPKIGPNTEFCQFFISCCGFCDPLCGGRFAREEEYTIRKRFLEVIRQFYIAVFNVLWARPQGINLCLGRRPTGLRTLITDANRALIWPAGEDQGANEDDREDQERVYYVTVLENDPHQSSQPSQDEQKSKREKLADDWTGACKRAQKSAEERLDLAAILKEYAEELSGYCEDYDCRQCYGWHHRPRGQVNEGCTAPPITVPSLQQPGAPAPQLPPALSHFQKVLAQSMTLRTVSP
jgi:hypothetical protein